MLLQGPHPTDCTGRRSGSMWMNAFTCVTRVFLFEFAGSKGLSKVVRADQRS